jgi:hypothetical protein
MYYINQAILYDGWKGQRCVLTQQV